jgi:hypothetical protein
VTPETILHFLSLATQAKKEGAKICILLVSGLETILELASRKKIPPMLTWFGSCGYFLSHVVLPILLFEHNHHQEEEVTSAAHQQNMIDIHDFWSVVRYILHHNLWPDHNVWPVTKAPNMEVCIIHTARGHLIRVLTKGGAKPSASIFDANGCPSWLMTLPCSNINPLRAAHGALAGWLTTRERSMATVVAQSWLVQ